MLRKIGAFMRKFFLLNLVFGIGMMVGSVIGTSVTLGFYGVPEVSVDQLLHNCPEITEVDNAE
jgi:hypothetical protein